MERGDLAPDCMYIFEMYDRLKEYAFWGYGFLTQYRRYFPGSQVLRVKKPAYGCSVLSGKPQFLIVKIGSLQVSMRIGEAYCDVRYFLPQKMLKKRFISKTKRQPVFFDQLPYFHFVMQEECRRRLARIQSSTVSTRKFRSDQLLPIR